MANKAAKAKAKAKAKAERVAARVAKDKEARHMLFEQMASTVKKNGPALAKEIGAIFQFVFPDQNTKFLWT